MKKYNTGELVKINTLRTATDDGMCTAKALPDNCIIIAEKIDLKTYPSCHDFSGKGITCEEGQTGTVVTYLGRPWKIKKSPQFCDYDIYEVLVNDTVCQIFSVNLKPIETTSDEWVEDS